MTKQRPWAILLAILAVLALAYPSATAVYEWLLPIRGPQAAFSAASGIELTYLALACLFFFTEELQRFALRLQLWAVFTAVLLNSIDSYSKRKGIDISTGNFAWSTFDPWLLTLSIGESIPLAGLAFGVSMILHRLVVVDVTANPREPLALFRRAVRLVGEILQGIGLTRTQDQKLNPLVPQAIPVVPRPPEKLADDRKSIDPSNLASDPIPAVSGPPRTSSEQVDEDALWDELINRPVPDPLGSEPLQPEPPPPQARNGSWQHRIIR